MIRTAIFALCLSSCAATAQENPLISAMQNAGKAYDHCFYQSVFAQMKAQRTDDNYDMMSERAFAACATEESAMVLLAQAGGVPAQTITITLTGLRLSLKRTVRDIVANPAKYAK
jgi:hypothetical protein